MSSTKTSVRARHVLERPFIPAERRIPLTHPGVHIREDFLEPLGMTPYRLAKLLRVPETRIHEILAGRRAITADTALRLGRLFNMSAEYWIGLQSHYDLEVAKYAPGTWDEIQAIEPVDMGPDPETQPEYYTAEAYAAREGSARRT